MSKIFVTSDLHFGHDREFVWKVRGYSSVSEMNTEQVRKWNETVKDEDDVYILGDCMLGGTENIEFMKQLNGKLHICLGNHDTANREKMYRELSNVVEVEGVGIRLKYRKYHFVMTHYPMITGNLEKESLRQMSLNLYGHTHQTSNFYNDMPYMYHVGVDSHDGYPVDLDDIIDEMNDKVRECKDFLEDEVDKVTKEHEELDELLTAISTYKKPEPKTVPVDQSRCGKCVYEVLVCGENDFYGNCPKYKRDPPDGGFYG